MHEAAKLVREEELLRLLLSGYMLRECAVQLHLSYNTVRKYAAEPGFMTQLRGMSQTIFERVDAELKSTKEDILERIEKASDLALVEMERLVQAGGSDMVRLKAAQDLMDRDTRLSRTKRLEGHTGHEFLNPMTLRHIASVAKEVDQFESRREVTERELPPSTTAEERAVDGDI